MPGINALPILFFFPLHVCNFRRICLIMVRGDEEEEEEVKERKGSELMRSDKAGMKGEPSALETI